jgi:NAD-dependent dihydropyrimidine dehydrogenase PreA subunit
MTMPHVICEPCVNVKDKACLDVCPVNCIYDNPDWDQLYIHPEECVDCTLCVAPCPVNAIFAKEDVPFKWNSYIEKNRQAFE